MQRVLSSPLFSLSLLPVLLACGGSPDAAGDSGQGNDPIAHDENGPAPSPADSDSITPTSDGAGGDSSETANGGAGEGEGGLDGAGGAEDELSDAGAAGAGDGPGGSAEPQVVCGDGVVQGSEWCDDGNTVQGDGCNDDCTVSGRSVDNSIELKDFSQSLKSAVIIGQTLYAVGSSREGAGDTAKTDELFVSVDLTATVLAPVSVVNGKAGKNDSLTRVTTDGSALYTAGKVEGTDLADALVEKRSLAGAVQWTRTFAGTLQHEDATTGIAVIGSQLHAVGYVTNSGPNIDMFLSKLSRTNAKPPITSYVTSAGNHYDDAADVAPLGTGAIVAGKIWTENGRHVWLRRVDANMATLWTTTWADFSSISRVQAGPDGQIALVGAGGDPLSPDSWVALFDANGGFLWSKYFDRPGYNYATGVAFDPESGDMIVCGTVKDHNWDVYVQRLSPEGEERWYTTFDGSGNDDRAEDVVVADDGTIWAVGSWGTFAGDSDYWIGRFAP